MFELQGHKNVIVDFNSFQNGDSTVIPVEGRSRTLSQSNQFQIVKLHTEPSRLWESIDTLLYRLHPRAYFAHSFPYETKFPRVQFFLLVKKYTGAGPIAIDSLNYRRIEPLASYLYRQILFSSSDIEIDLCYVIYRSPELFHRLPFLHNAAICYFTPVI